jgi:hypothetical protein
LPFFDDDELAASSTVAVPVTSVLDFADTEIHKRKRLLNRPESTLSGKSK